MTKMVRSNVALAAVVALANVFSFAQSGADTYKAKCASCHGATGMADSGAGKAMKVKPANDPEVKKMTQAQMGTYRSCRCAMDRRLTESTTAVSALGALGEPASKASISSQAWMRAESASRG